MLESLNIVQYALTGLYIKNQIVVQTLEKLFEYATTHKYAIAVAEFYRISWAKHLIFLYQFRFLVNTVCNISKNKKS